MWVKIATLLIIFGAVFYLTKLAYPILEALFLRWYNKRLDKITPKLDDMFLDVPVKRLMIIDVLAPTISGLLGYILTNNWQIALGCAVAGLIIPVIIVKQLEVVRRKKFAGQLVDGLMILSSSLKAGLSILQSFETLVEEMPAPISQEFAVVLRQMNMGVSLEGALLTLKKRIRVEELDMVVTSILVARETGGDLTETFAQLVFTIRERNKLISRVNALCIQGKLQGWIMSLLPIAFAGFVYQANPHFFDPFFKDDFGRMILSYAVASEIIGSFLIMKLSKVDI